MKRTRDASGPTRGFRMACLVLLAGLVAIESVAQAPEDDGSASPLVIPGVPTGAPATGARGGDEIDSLLKLPDGYLTPGVGRVAGAGEAEWRRRFERAHAGLDRAQRALEQTRSSLDEAAASGGASQWSVAPPGASNSGGPSNSPLSFKLSQELSRNREALEAAEKALRELRIEADLAGVPAAWRGDEPAASPRRGAGVSP